MKIEIIYERGWPHLDEARIWLKGILGALGLDETLLPVLLSGCSVPANHSFPGSPTFLVNGEDVEPESVHRIRLGERVYLNDTGLPDVQKVKFKIARAAGLKTVLFICTGNAVRSQMAEALVNHFLKGRWAAFSAGFLPAGISPLVVKVLKEIGIDAAQQATKHLDLFNGLTFDRVITLCSDADWMCTFYPAYGNRVHLPYTDPLTLSTFGVSWKSLFRKLREGMKKQLIPYLETENV
jgi:arsenate reductase (thioredoxin)